MNALIKQIAAVQEDPAREQELRRLKNRLDGIPDTKRFMGIDVGQSPDRTAIAICERNGHYSEIRYLKRLPEGMPYPDQCDRIEQIYHSGKVERLAVDRTGVGAPVFDLLRRDGLKPIGITFTSGMEQNKKTPSRWNIPKKDIIMAFLIAAQEGRVKIVNGLDDSAALREELQLFEQTISDSGHVRYSHPPGYHDDLLIAVALSLFLADNLYRAVPIPIEFAHGFGQIKTYHDEASERRAEDAIFYGRNHPRVIR